MPDAADVIVNGYVYTKDGEYVRKMSDAGKVVPQRWKTVIRHPIRKV